MPRRNRERLVGVIADTHGQLRPEALNALAGADLVVHAGDVGKPEVLQALGRIAPVAAVRGNVDRGPWAASLPMTRTVEVGGLRLFVLHELGALDLDPAAVGFQAVVSGHSHHPSLQVRKGVLYLNPGSAGPRRFRLPVALARLRIRGDALIPEIVELKV